MLLIVSCTDSTDIGRIYPGMPRDEAIAALKRAGAKDTGVGSVIPGKSKFGGYTKLDGYVLKDGRVLNVVSDRTQESEELVIIGLSVRTEPADVHVYKHGEKWIGVSEVVLKEE